MHSEGYHNYSTDWSQAGPIIERERICACPDLGLQCWSATNFSGSITEFGPTPLIAAMRCYVASKLGEEVEIPDQLI